MSHAKNLAEIIRGMDGEWHTTREIADTSADYWTGQRMHGAPATMYVRNILDRMEKMGQVEHRTDYRRHRTSWRLLQ